MTTYLIGAGGWIGQAFAVVAGQPVVPVAAAAVLADAEHALGAVGSADVIVNAAGSKTADTLQALNVDLVARIVAATQEQRPLIVHLGSAAEYGIPATDALLVERPADEHPTSPYGATKLAATELLRSTGRACVLRPFNIAAAVPQPGSPLADVLARVERGRAQGEGPQVLSAGTRRDWVGLDFVVESMVAATELRPVGVFNLCSGVAVSMAELVTALLARWGSDLSVVDLQQAPASTVVGDPAAWRAVSGMSRSLTAADIAALLVPDGKAKA